MLTQIDEQSLVTDIVNGDYRTASVFRKYAIDFCCGARVPLEMACSLRDINLQNVKTDLENAIRTTYLPGSPKFGEWSLDFLADYIVHIHHAYLKTAMPAALEHLAPFVNGHKKKYTYLPEVQDIFGIFTRETLAYLAQEEEILFPYIKQTANAYLHNAPYAGLLVRTLSKPVEAVMQRKAEMITGALQRLRELTDQYTPPANACTSHKVAYFQLREIDNDMVQHLHLENDILFPKAIQMEQALRQ